MTKNPTSSSWAPFLAVSLLALPAAANPRPLPFSYPHEQLAEGGTEIEQYIDYTQVRGAVGSSPNGNCQSGGAQAQCSWFGLFQFQTEFEHGITDRLELGLYVMYGPALPSGFDPSFGVASPVEGNGMKQRLRYKLADTGAWPIDVSLYGELVENQTELEIEGKIILQRRIGLMRIIGNASAEQEFEYDGHRDFVITPSGGLTFEASPSVQPGIEWWMRGEFPEQNPISPRPFALGPHQYLGPALLLQFGRLWWTNGVYIRLTDRSHTMEPGDAFGNFWVRSVIGLGFD